MLRIRFTRIGKKKQPSFRVVVAEKSRAVKRKYIEVLGHYSPAMQPKIIELKTDRIEYWISQGAQPTDSVAALLKSQGMKDMEKFMEPRNKKKRKKGEQPEEEAPAESAGSGSAAPAAAPAEETPKEEVKAEDKAETPAAAEAPVEEKAKEEVPDDKKEDAPAPEEEASA